MMGIEAATLCVDVLQTPNTPSRRADPAPVLAEVLLGDGSSHLGPGALSAPEPVRRAGRMRASQAAILSQKTSSSAGRKYCAKSPVPSASRW
eukprot:2337270-Pyramimonas_sp.AAC.1